MNEQPDTKRSLEESDRAAEEALNTLYIATRAYIHAQIRFADAKTVQDLMLLELDRKRKELLDAQENLTACTRLSILKSGLADDR